MSPGCRRIALSPVAQRPDRAGRRPRRPARLRQRVHGGRLSAAGWNRRACANRKGDRSHDPQGAMKNSSATASRRSSRATDSAASAKRCRMRATLRCSTPSSTRSWRNIRRASRWRSWRICSRSSALWRRRGAAPSRRSKRCARRRRKRAAALPEDLPARGFRSGLKGAPAAVSEAAGSSAFAFRNRQSVARVTAHTALSSDALRMSPDLILLAVLCTLFDSLTAWSEPCRFCERRYCFLPPDRSRDAFLSARALLRVDGEHDHQRQHASLGSATSMT